MSRWLTVALSGEVYIIIQREAIEAHVSPPRWGRRRWISTSSPGAALSLSPKAQSRADTTTKQDEQWPSIRRAEQRTGTHRYSQAERCQQSRRRLAKPDTILHGRTSFEWLENGAFLLVRSEIDDPRFPSGIAIIGSDDAEGEYYMLPFDERGVSRKYDVTLHNNTSKWWRNAPGFFQRYEGIIEDGGNTIITRGELSKDGLSVGVQTWGGTIPGTPSPRPTPNPLPGAGGGFIGRLARGHPCYPVRGGSPCTPILNAYVYPE